MLKSTAAITLLFVSLLAPELAHAAPASDVRASLRILPLGAWGPARAAPPAVLWDGFLRGDVVPVVGDVFTGIVGGFVGGVAAGVAGLGERLRLDERLVAALRFPLFTRAARFLLLEPGLPALGVDDALYLRRPLLGVQADISPGFSLYRAVRVFDAHSASASPILYPRIGVEVGLRFRM